LPEFLNSFYFFLFVKVDYNPLPVTSQPTTDVTLSTGNFTEFVENATTATDPEIVKYVPVSTTQIVILDCLVG